MKLLTNKPLKTFITIFSVMFIIEIIFKIGQGYQILDWSLFRIAVSIAIYSSILSLIFSFFNNVVRNICTIVVCLAATIYAIVQAGFNNYLGTYMSFATSTQAGAIGDFVFEFIASIKIEYWLMFIPFIIFIILFILFERKISIYESNLEISYVDKIKGKKKKQQFLEEQEKKKKRKNLITRLSFVGVFIISIVLYYVSLVAPFMQNDLQMIDNKSLFNNPSMPNIAVSQFGVEGFAFLDIKGLLLPSSDEDIQFVSSNKNNDEQSQNDTEKDYVREIDDSKWKEIAQKETVTDYKTLNNYYMSKAITPKNEYTGMFKDKNLIVIMIESGSNVLLNYPEYFPNILKLYNEGWAWDNAFSPRNACSTGNNEMSGITSLYTINRNCTANVYKDNTYYNAIFNLFNNKGYYTSSYHDYTDHFYYRHDYHPNMGSQKFMGVNELGIKLGSGYQPWPSDVEFVEKALPNFVDEDHFMAWLTTVSSHMSYVNSSVTGDTNLNMFKDKSWNIAAKRYMSKLIYVDNAIGRLIELLEEKGKLDDTVIMIYADHEPYGLNVDVFQQIAKYDVSSNGDVDRTPFIIYNPELTPTKYDKYTSFMNILPTLANLFDLDYDPRLYGGEDLLSKNYTNVVAFADGSWRSAIAYYDATSSKIKYLSDETYSPEEIKYINNKIKNEIAMNNLAIKRDYYTYLNNKLEKGFAVSKK